MQTPPGKPLIESVVEGVLVVQPAGALFGDEAGQFES